MSTSAQESKAIGAAATAAVPDPTRNAATATAAEVISVAAIGLVVDLITAASPATAAVREIGRALNPVADPVLRPITAASPTTKIVRAIGRALNPVIGPALGSIDAKATLKDQFSTFIATARVENKSPLHIE